MHLIILPCHSIYTSSETKGDSQDDWSLEPFQKFGDDHLTFKSHIYKSIELLQETPNSLLIISGGQTKSISGPKSESYSYWELINDLKLYNERIHLEEFARDSFENVLFSISRFYEITNEYPSEISIVGMEFKRERFEKYHLDKALHFQNFNYYGIDPKIDDYQNLIKSENTNALDLFKLDLLGNYTILNGKKIKRNPFKRVHGYKLSNPKLNPFFTDSILDENSWFENYRAPWE